MKIKISERDIYLGIFANDLFEPVTEVVTGRKHTPQSWLTQPIPSWTEAGSHTPMRSTRLNRLDRETVNFFDADVDWSDVDKEAVSRMVANYLDCDRSGAITTCDLKPEKLALSRVGCGGWTAHFADWHASMRSVAAVDKVSKGSSFVITVPYPVVGMNGGLSSTNPNEMGHAIVEACIEPGLKRGGLRHHALPKAIGTTVPSIGGVALVAVYMDYTYSNTADSLRVSTPYKETSIYSAAMKPGTWEKYAKGGGFNQSTQTDANGNSTGKEKRATIDKCISREGNTANFAVGLGRSWFRTEAQEVSTFAQTGATPTNVFQLACMEAVSVLFANIDSASVALAISYNTSSDVNATVEGTTFNLGKVLKGEEQVFRDDPLSSRKALALFESTGNANIQKIRFSLDGSLKAKNPISSYVSAVPNLGAILRADVLVTDAPIRSMLERGVTHTTVLHPYVRQNAFNETADATVGVATIIRAGEHQEGVTRWNGDFRLHACPIEEHLPICGIQGVSHPTGSTGKVQLRTADGSVGATVALSSLNKMSYFLRGHALGAVLPTLTPFCEDGAAEVRSYIRGSYTLRNGLRDVASNIPLTPLLTSESPTFFSMPGDSPDFNYKVDKGGQ